MDKNNLMTKDDLVKIDKFIKKVRPNKNMFNKTEEHIKSSYSHLIKNDLNKADKKG